MTATDPLSAPEDALGARRHANGRGDFEHLVRRYGPELHAHCYRMLGSTHDADDALQEALVKAWRNLDRVRDDAALRAWLYRIATNSCLDAIRRRPPRHMPIEIGAASSPTEDPSEGPPGIAWVEPYPSAALDLTDNRASPDARYERREAVELAFVAAMQHLSPLQRATLILRDVLAFSASETAECLNTSVASINSALQRARRSTGRRLVPPSQQATLRALGEERARTLVARFMDAWQRGDVRAVADLLSEDASFSMPPYASWWQGRDAIAALIERTRPRCPRARSVPVAANGQVAVGCYLWDGERRAYVAGTIMVFGFSGARIQATTSFVLPDRFAAFGLTRQLHA